MGKQIGKTTPSILFFTVLIETDWLIVALPVEENLLFFQCVFFPSFPGRKSRVQSFKSGIELQRLRHLWKSVIYLISQVFFTASDATAFLSSSSSNAIEFFSIFAVINVVAPRCLKITEKVSFNIASEASYVYSLSRQKLIKNAKNGPFWGVFENLKLGVKQCYQTGQF